MSAPNFVAEVPFESLTEIFAILRAGQVRDKWSEVVQHGAWTVGCTAKLFGGSPITGGDDVVHQSFVDSIDTQVNAVLALAPTGEVTANAINPALLIQIAKLILLLLQAKG